MFLSLRLRPLFTFALIILLAHFSAQGQNIAYARKVVDTLASEAMHGRGYVQEGHRLAAAFIANEFERYGLQPVADEYYQPFRVEVNTFPDVLQLRVNGKLLESGVDYLPDPCSPAAEIDTRARPVKAEVYQDRGRYMQALNHKRFRGKWMVVDETTLPTPDKEQHEHRHLAKALVRYAEQPQIAGLVLLQEKLTWHISKEQCKRPVLYLRKGAVPDKIQSISLTVEPMFLPDVRTQNVVAMVPGTRVPDSFMVFTGHYDHLGRVGSMAYIPGANDNASGIAMLLNLASHFAENPPEYSVVFIAFGGEELGLLGSLHFVANPLIPLDRIRFLLNMDIVGTGDDGVMVVNGKVHEASFERLTALNDAGRYLPEVRSRGAAANSDHHPFHEKGVPAFFFYTMGGINAYHDIYDRAETLPLTGFEGLFKLLVGFSELQMK